jgi:hypothetical protein
MVYSVDVEPCKAYCSNLAQFGYIIADDLVVNRGDSWGLFAFLSGTGEDSGWLFFLLNIFYAGKKLTL